MTAQLPKAEIRVVEAQPSRAAGRREHRWAVQTTVVKRLSEQFPSDVSSLTLLMHSPSRTFATPLEELARYIFTVELDEPVTDPYEGEIRVTEWRQADDHADTPES